MSAIESSLLGQAQVDGAAGRPVLSVVPDELADFELGVDELGSQIVGMAGRIAASMCRWLLLVAAFDARDGCARYGLGTTARWLTHYCGLSRRTAMEHVRVARSLAAHAPMAAAMSDGRLSYSHVRAISRIAGAGGPALVDDLVNAAEHGSVGQLEDLVRGLRTVDDNERAAGGAPGSESLSHRWRSDSRWGLSACLDPERAQALTRIAEIALAALSAKGKSGLPALRGDEQAAILIHLDASNVPPSPTDPDVPAVPAMAGPSVGLGCSAEHPQPLDAPGSERPYARIDRGPGLPERVIKRLLCLGRIRTVVHESTTDPDPLRRTPLDVGAQRRLASKKQLKALLLRDGGCAYPGCGSRHRFEAHHVQHWIHGGPTTMANLVLLCEGHHHAQHDGEFTITATERRGRFQFARADGLLLPDRPDPASMINTAAPFEHEHDHVHPHAATTRWDGRRLDRHYAIAVLAQGLVSTNQREVGRIRVRHDL